MKTAAAVTAAITTAAIAVLAWGYFTFCNGNMHGVC